MGSVGSIRSELNHLDIMKFLLISALVAAVSAEAQYLGAGYPYAGLAGAFPYTGYAGLAGGCPYAAGLGYAAAGVPFGSSTGLDPITQGLDPVTQGVAAPYAHYYGKRSAEPQYLAYGGLGYAGLGYAGFPYSSYTGFPYSSYTGCKNYVGLPV